MSPSVVLMLLGTVVVLVAAWPLRPARYVVVCGGIALIAVGVFVLGNTLEIVEVL